MFGAGTPVASFSVAERAPAFRLLFNKPADGAYWLWMDGGSRWEKWREEKKRAGRGRCWVEEKGKLGTGYCNRGELVRERHNLVSALLNGEQGYGGRFSHYESLP